MEDDFMDPDICAAVATNKRYFLAAIEKEFEPLIKSAEKQNYFDWTHLKRLYNNRKRDMTNIYCLRIYCDFAFNLFLKFNCENYELVIKIILIHKLVMVIYSSLDLCRYCGNYNDFPKHYLTEDAINSRLILRQINELKVHETCQFTNSEFYGRLAVASIYEGYYPYLQFLVKYGLSYNPEDTLCQVKVQLGTLFNKYVLLNPLAGVDTPQEREHFADEVLNRLYENNLLQGFEKLNFTRMNLIVLAVAISLCKRCGDFFYPDYAKCLDLYASTLPESPICVKDVMDLLEIVFVLDRAFRDDAVSLFKEVFPEAPNLSSPRSLKYLSRCKVRSCLKKTPSLETVLYEVEIPDTLKQYLLFTSD